MAAKKRDAQEAAELLRDFMIIHLGLAGVPQRQIREIVGVDISRVSRIVKNLRRERERDDK